MKRFNVTEALAFIHGNIDLANDANATLNESSTNIPTIKEINANISQLNQQFDKGLLNEVADIINDSNIDFEMDISQEMQQENEYHQDETGKRKASQKDWKTNVAKKRRSLGLSYHGKKCVDASWVTVERPGQ